MPIPTIIFRGTRAELVAALADIPKILAGTKSDPTALVEGLLLRMGTTLLGLVQDAFVAKSEGGTDEMGITWQPLSATTLALRRKGSVSAKGAEKLLASVAKLSKQRGELILKHFEKLRALYTDHDTGSATARKHAKHLLRLMAPFMGGPDSKRYKKAKLELDKPQPLAKAEKLALAGAFALILRDTGKLLNSFSPQINSDSQLSVAPGSISVGSNVDYFGFHDSDQPRKQKRDGSGPRLPRRQILPDAQKKMPERWWQEVMKSLKSGLETKEFWLRVLGNRARTA